MFKNKFHYILLFFFLFLTVSHAQVRNLNDEQLEHRATAFKFGISVSHGINIGLRTPINSDYAIEICVGNYFDLIGSSPITFGPILSYSLKKFRNSKMDILLVSSFIKDASHKAVIFIAPTFGFETYLIKKPFVVLRAGPGFIFQSNSDVKLLPNFEIGIAFDFGR